MLNFKYEALKADGITAKGVVKAKSSQDADRILKEQGLFPSAIKPVSAGGKDAISISPSLPKTAKEVKHCHSFGWKIRLWKLSAFHIPLLLVAGISFYLFFTGKPGWLVFSMMVAGLFVFGFAGSRIEAKTLSAFVCPRC